MFSDVWSENAALFFSFSKDCWKLIQNPPILYYGFKTQSEAWQLVRRAWTIDGPSKNKVKLSSAFSNVFERSSLSDDKCTSCKIEQNSIWKHLWTMIMLNMISNTRHAKHDIKNMLLEMLNANLLSYARKSCLA